MPEVPPLPDNTILLVEVGSTAHGTGIPGGEDNDEMGVIVDSPKEVLGLAERGFKTVMQRTQPEGVRSGPGDTDRTLYSLRRFLRLAVSGNPSIMMSLWAPVLYAAGQGHELRGLADAFVGPRRPLTWASRRQVSGAGGNRTLVRRAVTDRATTIPESEPLRVAHRRVGSTARWVPARLSEQSTVFPIASGLSRRQPLLLLPGCSGQAPCAIAGHDVSLHPTRSGGESEVAVGASIGCPV